MQAILLGRSEKSDGYILNSPHTKEFYVASNCKIDSGKSTATCFNLLYDGGMFVGLYDLSTFANGTEAYPPGTNVIYDEKKENNPWHSHILSLTS